MNPDPVKTVVEAGGFLTDSLHAWFFVGGVVVGLAIAAGATAWVVHSITALVREARETIKEMNKVVSRANGIAIHVAESYVPIKDKVDAIERELADIRSLLTQIKPISLPTKYE